MRITLDANILVYSVNKYFGQLHQIYVSNTLKTFRNCNKSFKYT